MSLLNSLLGAKPDPGQPQVVDQPKFRIVFPGDWQVLSPRDWRGKFTVKSTGAQSIEGMFSEKPHNERAGTSDWVRMAIDLFRKEATAQGAQVLQEALPGQMIYLEIAPAQGAKNEVRFILLGPTRILDVRAKELDSTPSLEAIRRSLKAIEWK